MQRALLLTLSCAFLTIAPAGADAASFFGYTTRAHVVTLTTNKAKLMTGTVGWHTRCGGRLITSPTTEFIPDPQTARPNRFSVTVEGYADPYDEYLVRYDAVMTGRRHLKRGRPSAEQWTGTFALTIKITKVADQQVVRTCRLKRQRWHVWREGHGVGTWSTTSDPGDYIGAGQAWNYDSSNAVIAAAGDRRRIELHVAGKDGSYWDAYIEAPKGRKLVTGQRFTTWRHPEDDKAGLDVGGQHRNCNTSRGEMTIKRARYDRRGRLRRIALDFVQHCDSEAPALRGTLTYRSHPWE